MAGAGFRTFIPGETLTADNIQNFLMAQSVQVYANAAARDAALTGVVSEGMVVFLKDSNKLFTFSGSAFEEVTPTNISANIINAGTLGVARLPVVPVTKGGTGGTTVTEGREGLEIYVQEAEPSSPATGAIWIF